MKHGAKLLIAALLVMQALTLIAPAYAQTPAPSPPAGPSAPTTPQAGGGNANSEQCTNFAERKREIFGTTTTNPDGTVTQNQPGLLTEIYNYIKDIVNDSTKRIYEAFINNYAYQAAVAGALTLMVIIFGVGFMIGAIQPSFGQVLVRLVKFGIIVALVSPGGWKFFSDYMVRFFNDGTDELVRGVIAIGTNVPVSPDASPFFQLDRLASFLIQPDTIIAIMGSTFAGGPYGMGMAGLMMFAVAAFVKLLIEALRVYAVSFVARALLLGLAPIFFIFLLFERTKQLFMTWLNALISLMLQPILLFTFLSFFMVLIESATVDMLNTELCWSEFSSQSGTTNQRAFWRFAPQGPDGTAQPIVTEMTWKGTFSCIVSGKGECPEFPVNVIDVLTFLILVYLAMRFVKVIERIANELANTYIALDAGGHFQQFMSQGSGGQATRDVASGANTSAMGRPPAAPPPATPTARPSDQQTTRPPGAGGG